MLRKMMVLMVFVVFLASIFLLFFFFVPVSSQQLLSSVRFLRQQQAVICGSMTIIWGSCLLYLVRRVLRSILKKIRSRREFVKKVKFVTHCLKFNSIEFNVDDMSVHLSESPDSSWFGCEDVSVITVRVIDRQTIPHSTTDTELSTWNHRLARVRVNRSEIKRSILWKKLLIKMIEEAYLVAQKKELDLSGKVAERIAAIV